MNNERFNFLVNSSLSHPMPMFTITRLMLCLRDVVESTGKAGEDAMERHCAFRDDQDERTDKPASEPGVPS